MSQYIAQIRLIIPVPFDCDDEHETPGHHADELAAAKAQELGAESWLVEEVLREEQT